MPIRVLQIVTYMGRGGLETMLMNYYRHIDRDKVQFDFLVHRDFEADYDREILALGGRIYHISRLIPWSASYKRELKNFFRSHPEYRIIHVHQDCLSSVALQCAKECGIPVRIAHSHSSNAVRNIKYPIKVYYKTQIAKYATHLWACGVQAGNWMFDNEKYEIVRNAIDTERYRYALDIRQQIRIIFHFRRSLIVGHVGNFTPAKNHVFLIDIFAEIKKIRPDAKLLLVGGGEGMTAIQQKAEKLGLKDSVIFTGVRSDVNHLLQAMDVFVFPSLYEGLPVTMVEAQAAGLPCVISDKVPDECIVTEGLVTVQKLSDSAENWAKHIVSRANIQREDTGEQIKAHGFDIAKNAKWLEEFYLKHG